MSATTAQPPPEARRRSTDPIGGPVGAAATAHPEATAAALQAFEAGGSAVDAAITAHAVLCVTSPQACGLGGDVMALVHSPDGTVRAVNGTGRSGRHASGGPHLDGGPSVTVPGLVDGWAQLWRRWGRLRWDQLLDPARRLAEDGVTIDADLSTSVARNRGRLLRGGAEGWSLLSAPARWRQPELAETLHRIATAGTEGFYRGHVAEAIAASVAADGGGIDVADLAAHDTTVADPVTVAWSDGRVAVQPPSSQGVLLALALQTAEQWSARRRTGLPASGAQREHLLVEITEAAFRRRDACADAAAVLGSPLTVDPERASGQGGPRAYLHTAGVATAGADGMVVSSLVSLFDDFGSATYVPGYGFTLNDRGAGFTAGANAPRANARPVHTLAPALWLSPSGPLALATPGADGQVQTLLQVLVRLRFDGAGLGAAVHAPRWRSEDGALLLEHDHPARDDLDARGHRVRVVPAGDDRFGAVVAAGVGPAGQPYAAADWRRQTQAGAR